MEKDDTVRIALASPAYDHEADMEARLGMISDISFTAAMEGAKAVCFPEAFVTGYAPKRATELAVTRDSGAVRELSAISARRDIDILAGFMEAAPDGYCVTHGLFRPDGDSFFYRKSHLGESEKDVFLPGGSLEVFPMSCGLTAGFQLCVELHVPEMTQELSRRGADIIFCPHSVPGSSAKRKGLWEKLLSARGYDSRTYIACLNDNSATHEGCFAAADPLGDIILSSFENEGSLVFFDADPALIRRFRSGSTAMSERYYPSMARKELY